MPNLFDIFKAVGDKIGDNPYKYRTPPFVDPHSPINAHPVSFGGNQDSSSGEPGLQNASFHIGPAQVPTDYTHPVSNGSDSPNPVSGDNDMDMFNRFNQI